MDSHDTGLKPRRGFGLSAKLLLLTVAFIMLAEVLVFVPSVSNFRHSWLEERLAAAQIAALAVEGAQGNRLPEELQQELLRSAQVHAVALKRDDTRRLILQWQLPAPIAAHYDLRNAGWLELMVDALEVYFTPSNRFIRVVGQPGFGAGQFIEIVMNEAPLHAAMLRFGLNILGLSIVISVITAAFIYYALDWLLVRPITGLTRDMERFSRSPDNPQAIIRPSERRDEIGTAERQLASMQRQIAEMLQQKSRLAALGLAVSKVNHDLRNMLSTAQLISDRLGTVNDPTVQRLAPKLIASIDRGIRLCTETLNFGRAEEAPPVRERVRLQPIVEEVADSLGLQDRTSLRWRVEMEPGLEIDADPDHLHRVLSNLLRNAVEAVETLPGGGEVALRAGRQGAVVVIDLSDTGPGLPPRARAHLFEPFQGTTRKGGVGLGLAIAAELVGAHGGRIELVPSRLGAHFRITIPDRVIDLEARRSA